MPNRYRRPLVLLKFKSSEPPSRWVERWVGTHMIYEQDSDNTYYTKTTHVYNLVGLGAN